MNASGDGRIVVAAYGDGTIRWHRADDGRELLALQVLPNKGDPAKWDWVLWTPEGFYEATPGAQDVLKWVINHGPDKAATTLPVSAIAKLHRPNALPLVLDQLETARALGIDEISQARLDVQAATGSAKPPGGVLHVLAIGVDKFGDKAGDLHLDYAAEDAHDVATALLDSQKGAPRQGESLRRRQLDISAQRQGRQRRHSRRARRHGAKHGEERTGSGRRRHSGFEPRRDDRRAVLSHPLRLRRRITGQEHQERRLGQRIREEGRGDRRPWEGAAVARCLPFRRGRRPRLGRRIPTPKSSRTPWIWKTSPF